MAHGGAAEDQDIAAFQVADAGDLLIPAGGCPTSGGHVTLLDARMVQGIVDKAGAIEAVYSVLSLLHQELYPSLQFREPIPATQFIPVLHYRKQAVQHVMSNSFGFGGNCTTLIFSKV